MNNYIFCELLQAISYAEESAILRNQWRRLRDNTDPFDVPDMTFIKTFRVDKHTALMLVNELSDSLHRQRSHGLPVASQVLTALRFFAVGSYQNAVGRDISNTMSQPSVSRCINQVAKAICNQLLRKIIKFPMTQHERQSARHKFENCTHPFPGAIGAIDCTHIAIIKPNNHEEDFLNHHGYHSMNVQMICDAGLKILAVVPKFGGSRHDSFIWQYSTERRVMELWFNNGERKTWILGDSGYPLEPWLMTPILHAEQGSPQERYTAVHVSARNVVERCFGLLKMRWRCLSDQRVLMYKPETAAFIINACAVLHNICIDRSVPFDEIEEEQHHVIRPLQASIVLDSRNRLSEARRVQSQLLSDNFLN